MMARPTRRNILAAAAVITVVRPACAEPDEMAAAINKFTGGREPLTGKVALDIAPLVENGNSVSVSVTVDHPMNDADFVKTIALFNEKNPQPNVAEFHLTPRAGRAWIATRMRLATTQHIVAVAKLKDGRCFIDRKEVIVTIAACTEE